MVIFKHYFSSLKDDFDANHRIASTHYKINKMSEQDPVSGFQGIVFGF